MEAFLLGRATHMLFALQKCSGGVNCTYNKQEVPFFFFLRQCRFSGYLAHLAVPNELLIQFSR